MEVKLELPKESYEIAYAIESLIKSYKAAKSDGWRPGLDIPAIVMSSFKDLMNAIEGVDKVADEFREMPMQASLALAVPLIKAIGELLKK